MYGFVSNYRVENTETHLAKFCKKENQQLPLSKLYGTPERVIICTDGDCYQPVT